MNNSKDYSTNQNSAKKNDVSPLKDKLLKYKNALFLLNLGVCQKNQEHIAESLNILSSIENPANESEENEVRKIFDLILKNELYNLAFVPEIIKKIAGQGNVVAQCRLAWLYMEGFGVEENFQEAFEWYKKAASQGFASGQCNLARMYENGIGIPKNYEQAVKWYKKAAEQGFSAAQKSLERLASV